MRCAKCGAILRDDAQLCPICDTPVPRGSAGAGVFGDVKDDFWADAGTNPLAGQERESIPVSAGALDLPDAPVLPGLTALPELSPLAETMEDGRAAVAPPVSMPPPLSVPPSPAARPMQAPPAPAQRPVAAPPPAAMPPQPGTRPPAGPVDLQQPPPAEQQPQWHVPAWQGAKQTGFKKNTDFEKFDRSEVKQGKLPKGLAYAIGGVLLILVLASRGALMLPLIAVGFFIFVNWVRKNK